MTRLLIATDGSSCAEAAARRALALFAGPTVEVTLLTVVDVRPELAVASPGLLGAEPLAVPAADARTVEAVDEALTREAETMLERTASMLGTDANRLVTHGDAASEICRIAAEGGYDVVAVGSHGSGFVKRVLVGSVSHHVVQHSSVPVLVIREATR